jgi:hypothetical protein
MTIVLFCIGTGEALAQVPLGANVFSHLTLKGSAITSNGDNRGDPVDKFSSSTKRFGVSDLRNRFSASSGLTYPPGANLAMWPLGDGTGDVVVQTKSGNFI